MVVKAEGICHPGEVRASCVAQSRGTLARDASYGYGWFLDRVDGRRRYRHEGTTIGFRNAVQRFPDQDLTVVLLSNPTPAPSLLPNPRELRHPDIRAPIGNERHVLQGFFGDLDTGGRFRGPPMGQSPVRKSPAPHPRLHAGSFR